MSYRNLNHKASKRWGVCTIRPQSVNPELRQYRLELNKLPSFGTVHPFSDSILNWRMNSSFLSPLKFCTSTPTLVDSPEKLDRCLISLSSETQLAIDTESCYKGVLHPMICLIQISTSQRNYIINALALFSDVKSKLRSVLENVSQLKIFHSLNDTLAFQRDFRIFTQCAINMQEVFELFHPSEKEVSFAKMVECFFDIKLDKSVRLADWRFRPLTREMIEYASNDTHFLIRCWDYAKELAIRNNIDLAHFHFPKSIIELQKVYKFPRARNFGAIFDNIHSRIKGKLPRNIELCNSAFVSLAKIRRTLAEDLDVYEGELMSDRQMYNVVLEWPHNSTSLNKHVSKELDAEGKQKLLVPFIEKVLPPEKPKSSELFSFHMESESDSDIELVLTVDNNEFEECAYVSQQLNEVDDIQITIPNVPFQDDLSDISDIEIETYVPPAERVDSIPSVVFNNDFHESEVEDFEVTATFVPVVEPELSRNARKRNSRQLNRYCLNSCCKTIGSDAVSYRESRRRRRQFLRVVS